MPIRKRLSDPDSAEVKEFNRHLRYGKPPPMPRKPSFEERKPFVDALASIPLGSRVAHSKWTREIMLPLMHKTYDIWGVKLAIYPMATRQNNDAMLCTGVQIRKVERDKRTGHVRTFTLKADQKVWYGRVLSWLAEAHYSDPA